VPTKPICDKGNWQILLSCFLRRTKDLGIATAVVSREHLRRKIIKQNYSFSIVFGSLPLDASVASTSITLLPFFSDIFKL
jgi:hypothetical protein